MLYQEFKLSEYDWSVYVFYNTTTAHTREIMMCLHDLGCDGNTAYRAYQNLMSGNLNTGLTFSKDRKTCIVLSKATDRENFAHTFTHEITHCAIHIANEYGISQQSERLAYIAGDLGAIMLPYASKFLCNCCNTKHK